MLIKLLALSPKEQAFLNDLAGKARNEVSPDLLEYIMDSEVSLYIRMALRIAKENAAAIKDWNIGSTEMSLQATKWLLQPVPTMVIIIVTILMFQLRIRQ